MKSLNQSVRIAAVGLLSATLGACASSGGLSDADKLSLYRAHAGEPVESFRTMGDAITGWTPLSDDAIAVWTRPKEAWLLDLDGGCYDIQFADSISMSESVGRVRAKLDRVQVGRSDKMTVSCRITAIRPLDVPALNQAQTELRQVTRAQASGT